VDAYRNIVATTQLGLKLDLKQLAMYAFNAEYNPKKFAACIIRMREPRSTALVFASGKLVCTGAKTEHDARVACRKYARMIQKVGNPGVKFKDFRIQNMVGRVDCKFPIRLEGLALAHQQFSQYEPELFPGLVYRMQHPRVVLLIFVSGKVVLTGAKKDEDIRRAFQQIYPVLREFRKEQTESQKQSDSKGKRKAQEQPAAA